MAVAFDAASEVFGGSPLTIPHTCAGSDRFLQVKIVHAPGGNSVTDITSVTYNGVAMNLKFEETPNRELAVYELAGPAVGTHDVVITWPTGNDMGAVVESYTGVDQTTPTDTHTVTDDGGTSASGDVTSATGDMATDALVTGSGVGSLTAGGGGQTQTHQITGESHDAIGASYKAGATTVSMSWTWTGFVSYGHWRWNINASSGGGGGGRAVVPVLVRQAVNRAARF